MSKQIKETKKFLKTDSVPKVIWIMLSLLVFVSLFCVSITIALMVQRLHWNSNFLRLAKAVTPFYGLLSIVTEANVKMN